MDTNKVGEKTMFHNLYCKIYVHTNKSIDELPKEIEKQISIKSDQFHSFENQFITLEILANKEYDKNKCYEFPDGFLYFKYNLEIDCKITSKEIEYIEFISALMKFLWGLGMNLVASCDFEEFLPNQGGFKKRINC